MILGVMIQSGVLVIFPPLMLGLLILGLLHELETVLAVQDGADRGVREEVGGGGALGTGLQGGRQRHPSCPRLRGHDSGSDSAGAVVGATHARMRLIASHGRRSSAGMEGRAGA